MSAGLTEGNSTDFYTGTGAALNAIIVSSQDVNNYQAGYLQITGTFSATTKVQGSNDGTNFVDVLVTDISNPSASPTTSITAPGIFYVPTSFRYFQLKITTYVSGTVSANVFFQLDISGDLGPRTTNAIQSGTWTVVANEDKNYGTVGANTLRTASQVGNATGSADFNAGTSGAQTLRVSSNITRNGTELSYNAGASDANTLRAAVNLKREGTDLDYNFGAASANTLRAASLIGNSTGAADFNAGALGAQTLRVCAILANPTGAIDYNYGTVGAQTIRSAAQLGNATGAADFNAGATGAQTLRTQANQGAPGTAANAWFEKITDGTNVAAVKAASTAAAAADPALVVGLSPNSPLPTGANTIGSVNAIQSGTWNVNSAFVDVVPATQTITALDAGTSSLVGANGQVFYFGTPTVNSAATFPLSSIDSVALQASLLGAGGTMVVEVSMDGGTFWLRPNVYQVSTQSYSNGFASPFIAIVNTSGMTHIRVRSTVSWTGTATILAHESLNVRGVTILDALPAGANVIGGVTQSGTWTVTAAEDKNYGTVGATTLRVASQIGNATGAADFNAGATGAQTLRTTANQGTPGTAANAWFEKITDGTNVAAVKAASTAAAAADPALVVSLSPNSSLPAGTNAIGTVKAQLEDNSGAAITLGQKTSANSVPVVLPSDQTITVTTTPLPPQGSGFSYGQVATSATTTVPVEATTYTEQTANSQMSIASSSANDTSAGTGARTVTIYYLDASMTSLLTTTAVLNGTSFVNLVTGMCYIEKIIVATVGSTGSNVGTLTLKATTAGGGATVGTVAATQNRTHWAHHYIPTGKTCYISGFNNGTSGNSTGQAGLFVLRSSTPTVANTPEIQISDFQDVAGAVTNYTRLYNSPIQVAGPARIRSYVTPNATSAYSSYSSFDYIDN